MAPEQALGAAVSPATDVFALGALAAYVSSGVQPFGEGPETAVLYRVVHEPPELDPVPADLRELVLRCLAKSPEDRPKPDEIIDVARHHPEVGGRLRFADGWLPATVSTELTRRSDLPRTAPAPTVLATAPSLGAPSARRAAVPPPPVDELPTAHSPYPSEKVRRVEAAPPVGSPVTTPAATPVTTPAAESATTPTAPPQAEARGRGVTWKGVLACAVVVALGASVAGVLLARNDRSTTTTSGSAVGLAPGATKSPAAATAAGPVTAPPTGEASPGAPSAGGASAAAGSYTPLLSKVELDIPGSLYATTAYQVDLGSGKLMPPSGVPKWGLALTHHSPTGSASADSFTWSGDDPSDFAVLTDPATTPAQCGGAIDTHPASVPGFAQASAGRLLCIRDRATGSIAIATIETADLQTGEVKLSLSAWQVGS
jgi:hypothetical protein